MKAPPPKFQTKGKTYVADRCKDVVYAQKANKLQFYALARSGYPGMGLRNNELSGVLSTGFWDAAKEQVWGLKTHCNEGLEITYLETGSIAFTVEGKSYPLKSGNLTVTRPWQPHSLGNPNIGPGRLHWIILDVDVRRPHQSWKWPDWFVMTPADIKRLTKLFSQNERHVLKANAEIASCFKQIAKTIENTQSEFKISRLAVLINQLFLSILNMLVNQDMQLLPELTSTRRTVELYLDQLKNDRTILAKTWTTVEMAEECSVGPTLFTRLCREITNMTPIQYLNCHKVKSAESLLKQNTDLTITEVAFECGFSSSQYFATVFKQFTGCRPLAFRKTNS